MKFLKSTASAALLCLPTLASANLITNGDFELGDTGFTSGYVSTAVAGGLAVGGQGAGAGVYGVGTSANFFHSAFTTAPDHTSTGPGNMMVVNGATSGNPVVWSTVVVPALQIGATYQFTAWVMNVYPDSPANLSFTFGGNALGTFAPTGNGIWQSFTASFVAANQSNGLLDLNLAASGNDFALDDISLVQVSAAPVPDGGLTVSLLGMAMTSLVWIRRKLV